MKYYKCGHIMTTHGIKGALKVKNLSDFDRFEKGNKLYILYQDEYVEVTVKSVSEKDDILLVTFKDLEDINLVEKYRNTDIYVSELDRNDDLEENEFYFSDLIGKMIINQKGEKRGPVKDIRDYPACKYLIVEVDGKQKLLPFRKEFIKEVREDAIIIEEIEGLF